MKKNKDPFKNKSVHINERLLSYLKETILEGSLLDLGCGPKSYSNPFIGICNKILTIDAWDKTSPNIIADLEKTRIVDIIPNEKFDYILMIDFIEHLDKSAGKQLLEDCKLICNKKIFVFTPLEEIWDDNHKNVNDPSLWCYGNQYDLHKSIWSPLDFQDWVPIKLKSGKGIHNYYIGYYEKT